MSQRAKLVVDASVVVKWYLPEVRSAHAVAILEGDDDLLAPDLLVAEFGNVLWKKVRRGELTREEGETVAHAFVSASPVALRPSLPLLLGALDLATAFHSTVYDALYLALAVAEDARLVTDDQTLAHALQGTDLAPLVQLLAPSA